MSICNTRTGMRAAGLVRGSDGDVTRLGETATAVITIDTQFAFEAEIHQRMPKRAAVTFAFSGFVPSFNLDYLSGSHRIPPFDRQLR